MHFELNPILVRETRARWRSRAFGLLFCGVAVLALAMVMAYRSATNYWTGMSSSDRASHVGAQLFSYMIYYQMMGWMLLAPSLTATAIAAEREHGLLEALQLSPLKAGQIVRGKLYSVLAFIGLLLLTAQPIMAICFFLGGVSPEELVQGFFQVFLTALLGASLGLCVSAWCRRAANAVGSTLALILLWGFGSMFALGMGMYAKINKTPILPELLTTLAMLNPAYAHFIQQNAVAVPMVGFAVTPIEPEILNRYLMLATSAMLLLGSVPAVRRPFAEQYWVEALPAALPEPLPENARPDAATPRSAPSEPKPSQAANSTVHLSAARLIQSANPILQRDLRAKLLFRRPGKVALFFQFWILAALGYSYCWLLFQAYTTNNDAESLWMVVNGGSLFGLLIAPATAGATAITRERESGTWQGLRLSLMKPAEIIFAKQVSSMAICLLFFVAIIPFVPACLGGIQGSRSGYNVGLGEMLATFFLLLATTWFTSAWGLYISNRCRKSAAATSWTMGTLFLLLAVFPGLFAWAVEEFLRYDSRPNLDLMWSMHPFGAFNIIYDPHSISSESNAGVLVAWSIFCIFAAGAVLLMLLHHDLTYRGGREE